MRLVDPELRKYVKDNKLPEVYEVKTYYGVRLNKYSKRRAQC